MNALSTTPSHRNRSHRNRSHRNGAVLWPVLCALASGALFALALPPANVEMLGWVALAPLLAAVAVPGRRRLHAVGLGMLAGVATGAGCVGFGDGVAPDRLNLAYLPFLWIGLVFATVSLLVVIARRRWPDASPLAWTAGVACAGVAAEWASTLTPLPVSVALCQHGNVALLQTAAWTGIWGVSFLLWGTNAAVADMLLRRRAVTAPGAVLLALVATAVLGGRMRLAAVDAGIAAGRTPTATVAAIQDFSEGDVGGNPNGTRDDGGDPPDSMELMRRASRSGAQLMVGSEEAFGSAYTTDNDRSEPARMARETGRFLVVGYQEPGVLKNRNCTALIGPDGRALGVYRKIHLFLGERTAVEAGDAPLVIDSGDPILRRIGLLICFDTCWTDLTRRETASGARILALPNYDPPTPRAALHYLHEALMPYRAVENGIAIVRADPTGLSEVVDPWGRIVARAPMYRAEAVVARTSLGDGRGGTWFTRCGDWLAYACVAAVAMLLAAVAPLRRSASPEAALRQHDLPAHPGSP
jgi:apolipoprotein N-acyltransferase